MKLVLYFKVTVFLLRNCDVLKVSFPQIDSAMRCYECDTHICPVGLLQHQTERLQWCLCELYTVCLLSYVCVCGSIHFQLCVSSCVCLCWCVC